jgi:hypothetical protein
MREAPLPDVRDLATLLIRECPTVSLFAVASRRMQTKCRAEKRSVFRHLRYLAMVPQRSKLAECAALVRPTLHAASHDGRPRIARTRHANVGHAGAPADTPAASPASVRP